MLQIGNTQLHNRDTCAIFLKHAGGKVGVVVEMKYYPHQCQEDDHETPFWIFCFICCAFFFRAGRLRWLRAAGSFAAADSHGDVGSRRGVRGGDKHTRADGGAAFAHKAAHAPPHEHNSPDEYTWAANEHAYGNAISSTRTLLNYAGTSAASQKSSFHRMDAT